MYRRARAQLFTVVLALVPSFGAAQVLIQSPAQPLVSAANESWFRAGAPIQLGDALYYPMGAPQVFDAFTMTPAGAYRGIPVYTATMGVPGTVLFVPIGETRVQPYVRILDTATRTPYPESNGLTMTVGGFVAQAPLPPMVARPYEVAPAVPVTPVTIVQAGPAPVANETAAATATETASNQTVGTSGRSAPARPVTTAVPPAGINNAWIEYDGRRWIADGKAIEHSPDLHAIGEYRGFTVYARGSDRSTIYVPSTVDLVVPYSRR